MPRYIIKEGILDKFFGGIFSAIGRGAAKKVLKALKFDPVLQKHSKEISKIRGDMEKHIRDKEKRDPKFARDVEKARADGRKSGLNL